MLTQPTGSAETAKMAVRALNRRIGSGLWVQFHTADPGTDSGSRVIPIARAGITQSEWTVAK